MNIRRRFFSILLASSLIINFPPNDSDLFQQTSNISQAAISTIATEDELEAACNAGGTYYVTENIQCTKSHTISSQLTLLAMNKNHLIWASKEMPRIFYINGGSLTLGSSTNDTYILKIRGGSNGENATDYTTNANVIVNNEGSFTMNCGVIYQSGGHGVKVAAKSKFTMNNGKISAINPKAKVNGAVIVKNKSSFIFNGGKITKNSVGGVSISKDSSMTFNSGLITTNTGGAGNPSQELVGGYGGGIYLDGTLRMSSGTISGNQVPTNKLGSGIYISDTGKMYARGDLTITPDGTDYNDVYVSTNGNLNFDSLLINKPAMRVTIPQVNIGSKVATCSNEHLSAYSFLDGSVAVNNLNDLLLTAKNNTIIVSKLYNITFNSDGGENTPSTISLYHGDTFSIVKSDAPKKYGYSFIGWYDENGNQYEENKSYQATKDLTLTAKWEYIPPVWTLHLEKKNLSKLSLFNDINETISYNHYSKKAVEFTITANRSVSSVTQSAIIYYQVVKQGNTFNTSASSWKKSSSGNISVKKDMACCVYIRAICGDKAKTIKTNGFIVDTTKPVIEGVKNNGVYNSTISIKCTDKTSGIKSITLNNKKVSEKCTISAKGSYKLVVKDNAGNKQVIKFKIKK